MKPDGGERERFAWSDPAGENRSWGAIRTRERRADLPGKLCIQREVDAIGPHDGARTRAQNRLSRNSPDALTSLWISVKELTGRVGGGTPDVGGVTVGGEGGLRGRGSTGSLQNGRNGGGGLGSVDGCRRRVREKGATRFRSFPRVSIRGTLSNQRPLRVARPAQIRRERGFKSFGVSTM